MAICCWTCTDCSGVRLGIAGLVDCADAVMGAATAKATASAHNQLNLMSFLRWFVREAFAPAAYGWTCGRMTRFRARYARRCCNAPLAMPVDAAPGYHRSPTVPTRETERSEERRVGKECRS